MEGFKRFPSLL